MKELITEKEKAEVLKNFMQEFFPFNEFKKIGFFTKEMKGDYQAQADRVCKYFGFKTVYEYGAMEVRAHITEGPPFTEPEKEKPFVTVITNIYED